MAIFIEIVKSVVLLGIGTSVSYLCLKTFKDAGMLFPDGIKNAELIDWAIGICLLILVFFVNLCVYSILFIILGLICA